MITLPLTVENSTLTLEFRRLYANCRALVAPSHRGERARGRPDPRSDGDDGKCAVAQSAGGER